MATTFFYVASKKRIKFRHCYVRLYRCDEGTHYMKTGGIVMKSKKEARQTTILQFFSNSKKQPQRDLQIDNSDVTQQDSPVKAQEESIQEDPARIIIKKYLKSAKLRRQKFCKIYAVVNLENEMPIDELRSRFRSKTENDSITEKEFGLSQSVQGTQELPDQLLEDIFGLDNDYKNMEALHPPDYASNSFFQLFSNVSFSSLVSEDDFDEIPCERLQDFTDANNNNDFNDVNFVSLDMSQ